ncbi:MAG TPA: hypothetical protein VL284_00070 [Thermoanaerobaculia bacterium]|nr:hypothetical protein [Thermoanaerobaculia bacterium]
MKAIRIALVLAVAVVWVLFAPDNFILRYGGVLALAPALDWTTRLIFGEGVADSDPLAADPVPSLSPAESALAGVKRERG